MINPFISSEKIIPEYFCDRRDESRTLIKYLVNGNNVVLISPRRVGKTGLIQYCFAQEELKDNYITIYTDILSTTNLQEMIFLLGKTIYKAIQPMGLRVVQSFFRTLKSLQGKLGYDPVTGQPTFNLQLGDISAPEYTLEEIFKYLGSAPKPCIVAIDEFQQIGRYPEKNVEALIRSHILQSNNCRFIFSGSERHLLREMFFNSSRPFYQSAAVLELDVIPEQIYTDFIMAMFNKGNKTIEEETAKYIYGLFDGITYYVQRICNEVYSDTADGQTVTEEILDNSIQSVIYSYDLIFRNQLADISAKQKETLFAIASEGKAEGVMSDNFIKKYSLTSSSSVQAAIRQLTNKGILTRIDDYYMVYDRFFGLWIKWNYCQ